MVDLFSSDMDNQFDNATAGYLFDFPTPLRKLKEGFSDNEDSHEIIAGVLQAAVHFYEADRAYMLEFQKTLS